VPPDGSLSPFPQSLDTPSDAAVTPVLSAPSALLADLGTGQVLFSKDPDSRRPIASLTKIMTGLLVLEKSQPSDIVTVGEDASIPEDDRAGISALGLEVGEQISVDTSAPPQSATIPRLPSGPLSGLSGSSGARTPALRRGACSAPVQFTSGLTIAARPRDLTLTRRPRRPGVRPHRRPLFTRSRRPTARNDTSEPQRAALALRRATGVETGYTSKPPRRRFC
jgi:hypothetical protein